MCKHVLDILISKYFHKLLYFLLNPSLYQINSKVSALLVRSLSKRSFDGETRLHKSVMASLAAAVTLGPGGVGTGVGSGAKAPYQKNMVVQVVTPRPVLRAFESKSAYLKKSTYS